MNHRLAIGLMSGTSCDGVDAALVRIKGSGQKTKVELLEFETIEYPEGLRRRLLKAPHMDAKEVCLLNFLLGERLGEAALKINCKAPANFIASHGHTLGHFPPHGTLQVGEPAVIAQKTGCKVISDFRPRDMAAGGQGAPLVPFADWILFPKMACLNIGGIANITVLPGEFDKIMAFDTGPGNMVMDHLARVMIRQPMDINGRAAAKGKVLEGVKRTMLEHPYFKQPPPKSAGREQFGSRSFLKDLLQAAKAHPYEDVMATAASVTAASIAGAVKKFILPHYTPAGLMVSGGGAHNPVLLDMIQKELPQLRLTRTEDHGFPSDAKEAVAFAILGNETLCNNPANVPSATGASYPVLLGKITLP